MVKLSIYFLILITFLNLNLSIADEKINKLKDLLEAGLTNEAEFKQAVKLIDNVKSSEIADINVRQITGSVGNEKFEKYEFYIDNYRVHTLSLDIRIDNLLTGETDVSIGAKFKVKFSRDGKVF